ncbi:MAG: cytidylate kinase-like family protein, partial [Oscillospiraceae bacterium]
MDNYVITIARGYGSGGKTIGKILAENLSIPFYDREILYMASEESGINIELFGKMDEKVKKGFFDPPTHKYTGNLIPPESNDFASDENLFNYQAKIIKQLAEKGPCIIVGRCADFILKDCENTVDAFIWAPMKDCIKNVMAIEPLSEKEAEKKIKKINAHRSEYYRYYACREWDNFKNYDLCINSSSLGYDKSANLIEEYVN